MKTANQLFESLNEDTNFNANRLALRAFLDQQLHAYLQDPKKGETLAYDIAGLMSARAIKNLPETNPYVEIIMLAGELELPPAQRDTSSTWEKFETLLATIPKE